MKPLEIVLAEDGMLVTFGRSLDLVLASPPGNRNTVGIGRCRAGKI